MNYLFFSFRHYGTNRAPMSLSFDTSWLLSNKGFTRELATWMRKILLDHSDVYFVTHLQVWKNALKKDTTGPKTLWSRIWIHRMNRLNAYLENMLLRLNVTSKRFWPVCEKKYPCIFELIFTSWFWIAALIYIHKYLINHSNFSNIFQIKNSSWKGMCPTFPLSYVEPQVISVAR